MNKSIIITTKYELGTRWYGLLVEEDIYTFSVHILGYKLNPYVKEEIMIHVYSTQNQYKLSKLDFSFTFESKKEDIMYLMKK
jgi:hypothetical protein